MAFEIEKGVPLEEEKLKNSRYPFKDMKVGDSFLIPKHLQMERARKAAAAAGKVNNMKFTCRYVENGLRIWRIE